MPQEPSSMFLNFNKALGPPYRILLDTNFLNFSISNKLDIFKNSMDCLVGKCIPYITDCVIAELEKLGHKYRMAIRLTKDPRFVKLTCDHKGTYADDCICNRVRQSRIFIVATCDKDLKRRIRKIPGVPIMFISNHKYAIEKMPESFN
jgi:U3 small nucleolar RNA-associated protein 24